MISIATGPASVILDQMSEIWPQKRQPGNPVEQWFLTGEEFLPKEEFHEFRVGNSTL